MTTHTAPTAVSRRRDPKHRAPAARAAVAPVVFVLMWSSGAIATPFGLTEASPQAFLAVRAGGCAVLAWCIWAAVRDALPSTFGSWTRMACVGGLMQVAYQGCFFVALDWGVTPGLLALIVSAQPILTAFATRAHHLQVWGALVLGVCGVALAVSADVDASSSATGIVAATGALIAITAGTMMQSRSTTAAGLWASLAIQSSISALAFAVILTVVGVGRWHPSTLR